MRFFRAPVATLNLLREQTMVALSQPNGMADEPWPLGGNFTDQEGRAYVAIGSHHTDCEPFGLLISKALQIPRVEEITHEEWNARKPKQDNI